MGTILDDRGRKLLRNLSKRTYTLTVRQQPERARLCSYKEENETIDRRPVDPPPVVELRSDEVPLEQLFESTSFFIRVTIVSSTATKIPFPDHGLPSVLEPYYQAIKTPTGADASTGEVIQTPEKLRLLDGKPGALCIFAKLSVRVPGVFRLMFTLYDTTESGVVELTRTVSEPFEVFSPKLFKGMHESTPLTRHLAAQGVKVKLRTDTSVGRQSTSRKRTPANSTTNSSMAIDKIPSNKASSSSPLSHSISYPNPKTQPISPRPSPVTRAVSTQQISGKGALTSTRSLVWRQPMDYYGYSNPLDQPQTAIAGPGPSTLRKRRFVDDGLIPSLREITAKYDFTPTPPATDLAAFSLSRSARTESPTYPSPSRQASPSSGFLSSPSPFPTPTPNYSQPSSHRSSNASMSQSNNTSSASSSTSNLNSQLSTTSRSTHTSISSIAPSPFPRLNIGPGDDGIPILPLPSMFSTPMNHRHSGNIGVGVGNRSPVPFIPPSVNQILERDWDRERDRARDYERDHDRDRDRSNFSSAASSPVVLPTTAYPMSSNSGQHQGISPRMMTTSSPISNMSRYGVQSPNDIDGNSSSPRNAIYDHRHTDGMDGGGNGMSHGHAHGHGSMPPPLTLPPIRQSGRDERFDGGR